MNNRDHLPNDRSDYRLVLCVYGLQLLGLLLVFPAVLGLAVSHLRRQHVGDALYRSHLAWQIRTTWWTLLAGLVGSALMYATAPSGQPLLGIIGALLVLLAAFWFMYRLVRGYLYLCERRPMPSAGGTSD